MTTKILSLSPVLSDFVPDKIHFVKLEGLGNDFVLFEDFSEIFSALKLEVQKLLIQSVCNRQTGIGADQVIFLDYKNHTAANEADISFFNADGEKAGACGNGTRCAALRVSNKSHLSEIKLHTTGRNLLASIEAHNETYTAAYISVNMGKPLFSWENIPLSRSSSTEHLEIEISGTKLIGSACSMGNPHFTIFCDTATELKHKAQTLGSALERHPIFKNGCNITFCHVNNSKLITAYVWERGSGLTLACGTGACGTFANARRLKLVDPECKIKMPGGILSLAENTDGTLTMSGNANEVFQGSLNLPDLLLRHYSE